MALIHTETAETARGATAEIYQELLKVVPFVPKPVQLMSASPGLMPGYWSMLSHIINHPRVGRPTLALLRLGVAMDSDFPFCIEFNSVSLKTQLGLTDDQLSALRQDPSRAELNEADKELALFAIRAAREPEEITRRDVQQLRDLGWDDESIFVATFQAAFMLCIGCLFTAFNMDEDATT